MSQADTTNANQTQLYDNVDSYGLISRLNHWLGAAVVLVLLGIGLYFEDMPKGDVKTYWMKLHFAIGALAFVFLAFRVSWRLFTKGPLPFQQPAAIQRLTKIIHMVLLVAIGVLIVTGPLAVLTGGHSIDIFGWFAIPSPVEKMPALHEALEEIHVFTTNVMLAAIILHVLGVVKHVVFERGNMLSRMIGRAR